MDKELLDSLINIVAEDKERVNQYKNFDKLLLTFTEEEIMYFLNFCDEDLFLNENLSMVLVKTFPETMKKYVDEFIKDRLDMIDNMENGLRDKLSNREIDVNLYNETIGEYQNVRQQAHIFKTLYMTEVERQLNKKQ